MLFLKSDIAFSSHTPRAVVAMVGPEQIPTLFIGMRRRMFKKR